MTRRPSQARERRRALSKPDGQVFGSGSEGHEFDSHLEHAFCYPASNSTSVRRVNLRLVFFWDGGSNAPCYEIIISPLDNWKQNSY